MASSGDLYWVIFYVGEKHGINVVENNDNKLYAMMVCCQSNALGGENLFKSDG